MSEPPIGIIADTHDDMMVVQRILNTCFDAGVEELVHLGDVTNPSTMEMFARDFTVHYVHGNGDEEFLDELIEVVESHDGTYYGDEATVQFGDATFFLHHGIEHGKSYAVANGAPDIDYVCHGHWHNQERTRKQHALVLNPGDDGVFLYDPKRDHLDYESTKVQADV